LFEEILGQAWYGDLDDYLEYVTEGRLIPGLVQVVASQWEETQGQEIPGDDGPFVPMEIKSYSQGDYPSIFESL